VCNDRVKFDRGLIADFASSVRIALSADLQFLYCSLRCLDKLGSKEFVMTAVLGQSVEVIFAKAEQCSREAIALVKNDARYSELVGKPSGWCVVTEKGLWSRGFHTSLDKDRLSECIEKGSRVILTVGLVSEPGVPLHACKYASVVAIAEPRKHSEDKLADIAVRAKLRAASSLHL
jgi:hypothetical protein